MNQIGNASSSSKATLAGISTSNSSSSCFVESDTSAISVQVIEWLDNWRLIITPQENWFGDANINVRNLVSNQGVVASDASGAGTARRYLAATNYGGDKGIFAYGHTNARVSMSNLISNSGVVASDTTGVGQTREGCEGAGFSYSA